MFFCDLLSKGIDLLRGKGSSYFQHLVQAPVQETLSGALVVKPLPRKRAKGSHAVQNGVHLLRHVGGKLIPQEGTGGGAGAQSGHRHHGPPRLMHRRENGGARLAPAGGVEGDVHPPARLPQKPLRVGIPGRVDHQRFALSVLRAHAQAAEG